LQRLGKFERLIILLFNVGTVFRSMQDQAATIRPFAVVAAVHLHHGKGRDIVEYCNHRPSEGKRDNNLLFYRKWLGVLIANLDLSLYSNAGILALVYDPSINIDV